MAGFEWQVCIWLSILAKTISEKQIVHTTEEWKKKEKKNVYDEWKIRQKEGQDRKYECYFWWSGKWGALTWSVQMDLTIHVALRAISVWKLPIWTKCRGTLWALEILSFFSDNKFRRDNELSLEMTDNGLGLSLCTRNDEFLEPCVIWKPKNNMFRELGEWLYSTVINHIITLV